eukprot:239755-Pyramimonas_sp.AAC.1
MALNRDGGTGKHDNDGTHHHRKASARRSAALGAGWGATRRAGLDGATFSELPQLITLARSGPALRRDASPKDAERTRDAMRAPSTVAVVEASSGAQSSPRLCLIGGRWRPRK